MQSKFFIVDALNICKENSRGKASISILLTLLLELKKKEYDFLCIFDESAFREFRRQGDEIIAFYKNITRNYGNNFSQIRGKADEKIVAIADKENCDIISNDTFHEYRNIYPWLKDYLRLAKVSVVRNTIFFEKAEIKVTENTDVEAVWNELKPYLSDFKSNVHAEQKQNSNQASKLEQPKATQPTNVSSNGSDIIRQMVECGFITPDVAQILKYGVDDKVAVVRTRKNEMVAVVLVIDKSGSMKEWQEDVIEGQKIMIQGLLGASSKFDIRFAQILFNHNVEYFQKFCEFRDKTDPKHTSPEVKILDEENYKPSGFTALYDAILKGICSLTPIIYAAQEQGIALETKVCIVTDGLDEGEYGAGSTIPPKELGKAIKYMLSENLLSNIILAGIGNYNYKSVGNELGIETVIEIPKSVDKSLLEETKQKIRSAFELFSKTGRTKKIC
jgi:hypothetical protein